MSDDEEVNKEKEIENSQINVSKKEEEKSKFIINL